MPKYKYETRTESGKISSGILIANSLGEATNSAKMLGGYLMNVVEAGEVTVFDKVKNFRLEFGPGLKDIYTFTTQLAVMLKAGINIRTAIGDIADQLENQKFKVMVTTVKNDVEAGKPFSEALAQYPKTFPSLFVNMVKAAELSGNLAEMLGRISATLSAQVETRSMVKGAMVYPAILGILAISATVFLLTWVLPKFAGVFKGKEDILPKPTKALLALSGFLRGYYQIILACLVSIVVAFKFAIGTSSGRVYWDRCKLKLPLLRKMFRAMYIARGLQTMGELINAGVPMLDTLQITSEVSGNCVYRDMWLDVKKAVQEGNKIAVPLRANPILPRNVIQMIAAGEESGNLGEVLSEVSDYYQRELKDTIKAVTSMLEPIMIVFMGVVVGFIAMSIILPVFKMSSIASGK
ncbi:MAG TPA: type II secretion system F family protein [Phycisphaerae bacterium]|nr:type II secretion system F family protein [Phycisphaerae bacterium]